MRLLHIIHQGKSFISFTIMCYGACTLRTFKHTGDSDASQRTRASFVFISFWSCAYNSHSLKWPCFITYAIACVTSQWKGKKNTKCWQGSKVMRIPIYYWWEYKLKQILGKTFRKPPSQLSIYSLCRYTPRRKRCPHGQKTVKVCLQKHK